MLKQLKFLAALCVFLLFQSNSAHSGGLIMDLSSVGLESLDVETLITLNEAMKANIKEIEKITNRTQNAVEGYDVSTFLTLRSAPTREAADALYNLIQAELQRMGSETFAPQLIDVAAQVLGHIATAKPSKYIDLLKVVKGLIKPGKSGDHMIRNIDKAIASASSRPNQLPVLSEYIQWRKKNSAPALSTRERLEKITERLDSRLIGQPEVAQALVDLEWRDALYGANERKLPDVVYLLGQPGTGKDTAAESIIYAIHGTENAHEKHLFPMPVMRTKSDSTTVLGSNTGYLGSDNFPPFLEFLVKHSNGRYMLDELENPMGKKSIRILENPDYKGETLPGYNAPTEGLIFLNEFHNWSKEMKDAVIKQALEKGYFTVNNPNGGVDKIYVPIRFLVATNEGVGLLTSREANGQRHGQPLTYEQNLAKWEKVHTNKAAIKNEILATNGSPNDKVERESAPGISEELLNRIPERFILLMRPLSPENLRKIVEINLGRAAKRVEASSQLLKGVEIRWTQDLVKLIQEYDYVAEENARPVKDRIIGFVEEPMIDAIRSGQLENIKPGAVIELDVRQREDQTRELVIKIQEGKNSRVVAPLIRTTLKDIPAEPMSDERIDRLLKLGDDLKGLVFGIDEIVERIAQRVLAVENESSSKQSRPASVLMLNGLSSTGKTQLAKELGRLLAEANGMPAGELPTFDFSNIQTLEKFQSKILGMTDSRGNPIKSEFMKLYDRNNGNLTVAFDELANVRDADLLRALYDFFRMPVVTTFSDGIPRPMGGVKVIATGNAGQEIYDRVPRYLPLEVQMAAWQEIFEQANRDHEFQRQFLERAYPGPLLSRINPTNIFFMPPHNYRSLRQLAQLKLSEALERIKDTSSRRGWEILFPSEAEYSKLVDTIVDEGFKLRYQGASIDSFVRDDFEERIKYELLKDKIPSGAKVVLRHLGQTDNSNEERPGKVTLELAVVGRPDPLQLEVKRSHVPKQIPLDPVNQIVTAYHEAGHILAQLALFPKAFAPIKISIIPGVTLIGENFIYYAGVARHRQEQEVANIRERFVREIASFAAGETAERLVTRGARDSAGKSNDMERATRMARDAIIKYGLSAAWGTNAVPEGVTVDAYIAGLSEQRKVILEAETMKLVQEGRQLAEITLLAHFESHLIPLANLLAEKGEVERVELKEFFEARATVDPARISLPRRTFLRMQNSIRKMRYRPSIAMGIELDGDLPLPKKIADIREIAMKRKAEQYASVPLPKSLPLAIGLAAEVSAAQKPAAETEVIKLKQTEPVPRPLAGVLAARTRCIEIHAR